MLLLLDVGIDVVALDTEIGDGQAVVPAFLFLYHVQDTGTLEEVLLYKNQDLLHYLVLKMVALVLVVEEVVEQHRPGGSEVAVHSQSLHIVDEGVVAVDNMHYNHSCEVVVVLLLIVVVGNLHSNLNNHRHLLDDQMAAEHLELREVLLPPGLEVQGSVIRSKLHIDQHTLREIQLREAGLVLLLAIPPSPAKN